MKNKFILITLSVVFLSTQNFSQEKLFIPRNIQPAYEKGTRSPDGNPGNEYWQNSSDYKIDVEIDPSSYFVDGTEQITYYNNSPDTLKQIVLRLYPNIFKKGSARDFQIVPDGITDGVSINKLIIGKNEIDIENKNVYKVYNTIATVYLAEFVPPESSVNFSIEWSFNISSKATLRMGVYDSTTVLVGYWYPQIAVYDDIDGWDFNIYSGLEEFYNDFSNFDVSVTLPNKFGVWATGQLQNPKEVFSEKIYQKFLAAQESDTVVRIITFADINSNQIYNSDKSKNTWHYKADSVTDFVFAISDHYLWDGVRVNVDSAENKKVFVQAIYPNDSPDFHNLAEVEKNLVLYFFKEMPGVKFPFPSFIAFNNGRTGGGMEFPMMINDGSPDIMEYTVSLTAHEMGHQYFPFYVGTNEQKYAFMDEGWANFLSSSYMEKMTGFNARLARTVAAYENLAGTEDDIPEIIPSLSQPYGAYRNSAYNRSSIAYEILSDMLGDELFQTALKEYIHRWKGKHPIPDDFYFTFNEVTGQNLNWFWKPWFFEIGYPDLAFDKVNVEVDKATIVIKNNGTIPVPIKLTVNYEDGSSESFYFKADSWKENSKSFKTNIKLSGILKDIKLGDINIPDSNRENNLYVVH
jgi:hypothetical protein